MNRYLLEKRAGVLDGELDFVGWETSDLKSELLKVEEFREKAIEQIKSLLANEATFENTFGLIDRIYCEGHKFGGRLELMQNVSTDSSFRSAAAAYSVRLEQGSTKVFSDKVLYHKLKEFALVLTDLRADERKYVEETCLEFKRLGLDLSDEQLSELMALKQQLTELEVAFRQAINDYSATVTLTASEAVGLSERFLESLPKNENGEYVVNMSYPQYVPAVENLVSDEKRAELVSKFNQKGGQKNIETLKQMTLLRNQAAKMLGYDNHAEFQLETRMAKNSGNVMKFMRSVVDGLKPLLARDTQMLVEAKRKYKGQSDASLDYFDVAFYSNELKKELGIDDEILKEYFPLDHVLKCMFDVYGKLFGIGFREVADAKVWEKSVKAYEVVDGSGEQIAWFYLDLFPREGKYGHAACFPVQMGAWNFATGVFDTAISALVCNFTPPQEGIPSLLAFGEVETFFHEFGHLIHHSLSKAPLAGQSGTNTAHDFVEAPSQMLENWVWQPEVLSVLSKHFQTGESLSAELADKLVASRSHLNGLFYSRQGAQSLLDMALHTDRFESEPAELWAEIYTQTVGLPLSPGQIFPAGFGHLEGYDAGYYGYLWSEVYAHDMFSVFLEEGILNGETGRRYKEEILEVGSSRPEAESLEKFLGRMPSDAAFLKYLAA